MYEESSAINAGSLAATMGEYVRNCRRLDRIRDFGEMMEANVSRNRQLQHLCQVGEPTLLR